MSRRRAGQGLGYLADDAAERAVYVVSVAAELAGMHPQPLRQYDRLGLVSPARTRGRGGRADLGAEEAESGPAPEEAEALTGIVPVGLPGPGPRPVEAG